MSRYHTFTVHTIMTRGYQSQSVNCEHICWWQWWKVSSHNCWSQSTSLFTIMTSYHEHSVARCSQTQLCTRYHTNRECLWPVIIMNRYNTFTVQTIMARNYQSQYIDCEHICWWQCWKVSSHNCWSQSPSLFTIMTSYHEHSVAWCNQTQLWTRYHTNRECL